MSGSAWGPTLRRYLLPFRWSRACRAAATPALLALVVALATPASALANRLYVNLGDSVGAGFGAASGHSYFDLYCAYLESSSVVDRCVNEAAGGATTESALSGGMVQKVIDDITSSTNTPLVTVSLGGNDLLGTAGCQPITGPSCPFSNNVRSILNQLHTALATRPGTHTIKWLEYYNPNHDNPYGTASADQSTAVALLGSDLAYTDCASHDVNMMGLDDLINCITKEQGATPVDAYTAFQKNCTNGDCFSDALHPNDKGHGLIFDAFRDSPGPYARPTISRLSETRSRFAPSTAHHTNGTVFSFVIDQPSILTIEIALQAPGRRVGGACRPPSRRLRHKRPCIRTVAIGALVKREPLGPARIVFSGRVRGHALKPGRYVATFTAKNSAGRSASQSLRFTVI